MRDTNERYKGELSEFQARFDEDLKEAQSHSKPDELDANLADHRKGKARARQLLIDHFSEWVFLFARKLAKKTLRQIGRCSPWRVMDETRERFAAGWSALVKSVDGLQTYCGDASAYVRTAIWRAMFEQVREDLFAVDVKPAGVNRRKRNWAQEFERKFGRKPGRADRHLFTLITHQELPEDYDTLAPDVAEFDGWPYWFAVLCRNEQESAILQCLLDGDTQREIAEKLNTNKTAIQNIRQTFQKRYAEHTGYSLEALRRTYGRKPNANRPIPAKVHLPSTGAPRTDSARPAMFPNAAAA